MAIGQPWKDIELWAQDGLRAAPEDHSINRATGFTVAWEQDGGEVFRRDVFQQLLFEMSTALIDIRENGLPPRWDQDVEYRHPAFCKGSNGEVYRSRIDNGPRLGNSQDPVTDSAGTTWEIY